MQDMNKVRRRAGDAAAEINPRRKIYIYIYIYIHEAREVRKEEGKFRAINN